MSIQRSALIAGWTITREEGGIRFTPLEGWGKGRFENNHLDASLTFIFDETSLLIRESAPDDAAIAIRTAGSNR